MKRDLIDISPKKTYRWLPGKGRSTPLIIRDMQIKTGMMLLHTSNYGYYQKNKGNRHWQGYRDIGPFDCCGGIAKLCRCPKGTSKNFK